jgi:hypothetical protein
MGISLLPNGNLMMKGTIQIPRKRIEMKTKINQPHKTLFFLFFASFFV